MAKPNNIFKNAQTGDIFFVQFLGKFYEAIKTDIGIAFTLMHENNDYREVELEHILTNDNDILDYINKEVKFEWDIKEFLS